MYSFGERIGEMMISGLSFGPICVVPDPEDPLGLNAGVHGLEWLNDFYQNNRLYALGTPLILTLGKSTTFTGFLTGLVISSNDPERGLGQFAMELAVIPEPVLLR